MRGYAFTNNLCQFIYKISPFLLVLIMEILPCLFRTSSMASLIGPSPALCVIFFWAVHAPYRFSGTSAFIAGLCADILFMLPLGSLALIFFIVFQCVKLFRRFLLQKEFVFAWIAFAVVSLLSHVLLWIILSLLFTNFAAFLPILFNFVFSAALYPIIADICGHLLSFLIRRDAYE